MAATKREINENVFKMLEHIGSILKDKGFKYTMVRNNPKSTDESGLLPEPVRMGQSTVQRVMNKNYYAPIDLSTIEKICQLTGMQPSELFKGIEIDLDEKLSLDYFKNGGNNEQENQ